MRREIKIAVVGSLLCLSISALVILGIAGGNKPAKLDVAGGSMPESAPATSAPAPEQPYSVTMSPMGAVTFVRVPKKIITLDANYNDMLVGLGRQRGLIATGYRHNQYDGFYRQLPGVDTAIDYENLKYVASAGGGSFDKETLYSLHADVHHIDPVQLSRMRGWSKADVEEIARNVGPFFANRYSRTGEYQGSEPYEFYTLWELSGKVAEVYRDEKRFAELKALYDQMVSAIQAKLPPAEQRPKVGLVMFSRNGMTAFNMSKGFGTDEFRAVGAVDAFASVKHLTYADGGGGNGRLDMEGLLSIDPDVIIMPWAIYDNYKDGFQRMMTLDQDPLGQKLKAVKNHRIYRGGSPLQGPVFSLFQVEMAAKQIYPELFGPYHDDQQYAPQEQLFDRKRVAAIIGAHSEMVRP